MALKKFKDEYGDVDVPLTHVSTIIYCVGNFLFCFFLSISYAQIYKFDLTYYVYISLFFLTACVG